MSHHGNTWLLGLLAGFLLILGANLVASVLPQDDTGVQAAQERAAFLRSWKPAIPIGSEAPNFTLKDRDGQAHSLAEFRDKTTLLCFYSDDRRSRTWAREMQKLWDHIGKTKMHEVVVVSLSKEAAIAFARETKDTGVYLFEDADHHPVRDRYGAAPGPNAWVIDRKGKIQQASAPIDTDENPDQDFNQVYQALRALVPLPVVNNDIPAWARGVQRPPPDRD